MNSRPENDQGVPGHEIDEPVVKESVLQPAGHISQPSPAPSPTNFEIPTNIPTDHDQVSRVRIEGKMNGHNIETNTDDPYEVEGGMRKIFESTIEE